MAPNPTLFGTNVAPASGLFGAATATTQTSVTSTPALSFGTPITTAPKLGLFSTPTTAAIAPNLSFGATTAPNFSFGTSTASTTANQIAPTGLSFGKVTQSIIFIFVNLINF